MRFRFGPALFPLAAALVTCLTSGQVHAQTSAEVAQARALFGEALKDEEAGQSAVALEKFQRVQQVKDTPQVRFRIGSCLEKLGKLRSARESYQAAAAMGAGSKANAGLVSESQDRVSALTRRIPDLTVSPVMPAPSDAVVKVDEAVVPSNSWQTPLALDPGDHAIDASASGYEPFHTTSTLSEGSHASVVIPWKKATPVVTPPVGGGNGNGGASGNGQGGNGQGGNGGGNGGGNPPGGDTHGGGGISQRTWGWISVGVGGALLVTSGIFVLLRHGEISTIKDACNLPNGGCPRARQNELQSAHDHAGTDGTISLITAGVGVVGVGVGVALLLTAHPSSESTTPATPPSSTSLGAHLLATGDAHGASIGWRGSF